MELERTANSSVYKSTVKNEKNIFKSCVCGKQFFSKSPYYAHKKCCTKEVENNGKDKKQPFKTCDCGKNINSKRVYNAHKKCCTKNIEKKEKPLYKTCDCGKKFHSKTVYYDHKKCCSKGKEKNKLPKENYKCQEENCSFTCSKQLDFLGHIKDTHSIDIASCWEERTFQTYEEFEDWKEQFEKSTKAAFKVISVEKTLTGTSKYFKCNRSGSYSSQSTGKRVMKSQGLSKIGFNCTASIKVQLEEESSTVRAKICHLHYGHDHKLSHLRISKSDRALLANQLVMGIEHSRIQQNIFTIFPTELQRQHLTTKVDLQNISKAYGINKIEKHTEDHLSVDAYVEENLTQEKSIFLYKRQGESFLHYPQEETCTLEKEDFALGIMTDFQSKMLQKFGDNILCFDATHGTNSYDFKLITVLVVDEYVHINR